MPAFPPYLPAAAARARTDELIRRADEHRACRRTATVLPTPQRNRRRTRAILWIASYLIVARRRRSSEAMPRV